MTTGRLVSSEETHTKDDFPQQMEVEDLLLPDSDPPPRPRRQRTLAAAAVLLPVLLALTGWSSGVDRVLQHSLLAAFDAFRLRLGEGILGGDARPLPAEVGAVLAVFSAVGTYSVGRTLPPKLRPISLLVPLGIALVACGVAASGYLVAITPLLVAGLLGLVAANPLEAPRP